MGESVITADLYRRVLLEPLSSGADRLIVVSGYASAVMASRHVADILEWRSRFRLTVVVGMSPEEGVDLFNHKGFLALCGGDAGIDFECKYVYEPPPVHSKLYIWCENEIPVLAYTGSANYTQQAFNGKQQEILIECSPTEALDYYDEIERRTIYCTHGEVEDYVCIRRAAQRVSAAGGEEEEEDIRVRVLNAPHPSKVTLSLLQRGGEVGKRSGLNWGQREGREPNQAYIPLPSRIAKSGFFPLGGQHFTVITDDNKLLIMRVEQQNNKAITTPLNNSLIGEYFRSRLGLANGQFVTREHLERYGRTNVDFYKIDDETFYMDFRKPVR